MNLLMVALPAVLWTAGVYLRKIWIFPRCAHSPQQCSSENIPWIDSLSAKTVWMPADFLSFVTQDSAAVWAMIFPLLWVCKKYGPSWKERSRIFLMDWLILLQTTLWNGLLTESTRLWVQRPRPFVFAEPHRFGADPSNYTSFYSGHTSFTAAAALFCLLTLIRHRAPRSWVSLGAGISFTLMFLTALFRVLSERHFITDTLAGMFGGFFAALVIQKIQRTHKTDEIPS